VQSNSKFFPFGTLSVNILGSFIIGVLIFYVEEVNSPQLRAVLITGFLGALTTFSTFSYETLSLIQDGAYQKALLNIALNVILSLLATALGMYVYRSFTHVV
jgi:CrcB protein